MQNKRWGITRFLVPHPDNRWFLWRILLGSLIIGLILCGVFWWYHQQFQQSLQSMGLLENEIVREELFNYLKVLKFMLAGGVVFNTFLVTLLSAYLFHKIAGPMYHLKIHLEKILSGGSTTELHFRKGDRFQEIANMLNQVLKKDQ